MAFNPLEFKPIKDLRIQAYRWRHQVNRWRQLSKEIDRAKDIYSQRNLNENYLVGKRLLCWEASPWVVINSIISSIAFAARMRGAEAKIVLCDGPLDYCPGCTLDAQIEPERLANWSKGCSECWKEKSTDSKKFLVEPIPYSKLIPSSEKVKIRQIADNLPIDEIYGYEYRGVSVGAHTETTVIRHYADMVDLGEWENKVKRNYLYSSMMTTAAAHSAINSFKPDKLFMLHALYAGWGPAYDVAAQKGISTLRFGDSYIPHGGFFFTYDRNRIVSPRMPSDRVWERIKNVPLTERQNALLDKYLHSRYESNSVDVKFKNRPTYDAQATIQALGMTNSKPIWCIFPQVRWDAMQQRTVKIFDSFDEWLIITIKQILDIPDIQWMLKVHPAEKKWNSKFGVVSTIIKEFGQIPDNLKLLDADTSINTMDVFRVIDGAIVFIENTVSLELAMMNKPVITAGDSVIYNRGITHDATSKEHFISLLKCIPEIGRLGETKTAMARRLGFHYFVRSQIPLRMFDLNKNGNFSGYSSDKLDHLLPGKDPFIDLICRQMFHNDDIAIDDSLIEEAASGWRT